MWRLDLASVGQHRPLYQPTLIQNSCKCALWHAQDTPRLEHGACASTVSALDCAQKWQSKMPKAQNEYSSTPEMQIP